MKRANVVTVQPVLLLDAYADGDQIGSAATKISGCLASDKGVVNLISMVVIDNAKQTAGFDVLFFNQQPTLTGLDNAELDISDAEFASFVGALTVATADFTTGKNASWATYKNINLLMEGIAASDDLWIVLRSKGSNDWAAATDLTLKFGFIEG